MRSRRGRPAAARRERKTAVHERAEELGIEVRTPRTLRDAEEQARFRGARRGSRRGRCLWADPAASRSSKRPRPAASTSTPRSCPRWRGAAPIQRAILAGDEISGVTIMRMDEGLDTGPMLLKRELDIVGKNAGQVTEELAQLGAAALIEWLDHPTPPERSRTKARPTRRRSTRPRRASIGAGPPSESSGRSVPSTRRLGRGSRSNGERVKLLGGASRNDTSRQPGEVARRRT